MATQLTLGVALNQRATLDNFCWGENVALKQLVSALLSGHLTEYVYIWGTQTTGRTHLLQACCQALSEQGKSAFYLPLKQHEGFDPDMLSNADHLDLVALDDVDVLAGLSDWEEALFHLYNACLSSGTYLIMTGHHSPDQVAWRLKDWGSRFRSVLAFEPIPLSDVEKIRVLQQNAREKGLVLKDSVATYLLSHYPRDLGKLMALLDQLDQASLSEQRKLTIPFVQQVLG